MRWILSLFMTGLMLSGLTASAQTYNRVTEQVVRDPGKPGPEDFALYLRNSSFYDMFSPADLHALDSAKEQKVFAYKAAMLKNFELSYAAAAKGGSYNEWRVPAHKKLAKLKPEKYVDISETILRPQYTEVHLSRSGKGQ